MKFYFTADEHYGHANIIKYCHRPFESVKEMDEEIIRKHNEVVGEEDTVFHLGDFTLKRGEMVKSYIRRLNGNHIFVRGSHDYWMGDGYSEIIEKKINDIYIVMCHYAMRVWSKSHYNSWQLYGHSHGGLKEVGKQLDVGVDTNDFYPYSFEDIKEIMDIKPNNFNLIKNTIL